MSKIIYDQRKKEWKSSKVIPIFDPHISIGQVLAHMMDRRPNKICQISDNNGIQMTNRDIKLNSIRVANNLMRLGYIQGDIIGVVAKNSHHLASVVFGTYIIGATVNTIEPSLDKEELIKMFQTCSPNLVFCDDDNLETVKAALRRLRNYAKIFIFGKRNNDVGHVEDLFKGTISEDDFVFPRFGDNSKVTAHIIYSSGTTGLEKAVSFSHRTLIYKHLNYMDWEVSGTSILLCFSSLNWLTGVMFLLIGTLNNACRIITKDLWTPEMALIIIEKYQVTDILSHPYMMKLLLMCPAITKTDLSHLKRYICGGDFVPSQLKNEMQKYLTNGCVSPAYGITEMGGICAILSEGKNKNSVGSITESIVAKVTDEDGNNLSTNEVGEIWLKSPYIFSGYCEPKNKNDIVDGDGWFHSLDIGYFDKECDLFIIDRKKDMLRYGDYTLSPSEIENLIVTIDGVERVSVVNIHDTKSESDMLCAVIEKSDRSEVQARDVIELLECKMTDFKRLQGGVFFVEKLPLTASGKIKRMEVRQIANKMYSESHSDNL